MSYSGKLRQRTRRAGGGHLPSSGAPPLGLAVPRHAAPFALVQPESAEGRPPPQIQSPSPWSGGARHPASQSPTESAWIPPSPPGQLPAAGEGGELSGGSRPRQWGLLGSWRGRTMTIPWVQPEDRQCVRAPGAPDPWRAFLARIRDLRGPGPALSASPSPRTLTWLGRPGSLPGPEGLWRLRPPGRPRQGLGRPAGLLCVPGLGTGDSGARREEPPWPPLAPPCLRLLSGRRLQQ